MLTARPSRDRPSRHAIGACRVLFVDADASVRDVTRDALERMGATIRTAGDSPEAARLVATQTFDVLVVEWSQWSEPGRHLALLATQAQPGAGLVLVDGGADVRVPAHAIRIAKPFTPSALAEAIEEAIARRSPNRS